ncbi:MAG: response regulator [Alphaproteobacteria bacterium]|nr:response regulator [Alphaproteobacteria bacterium]MBU0796982.1 response regulator [Alphaproteobacteria bacterium]MBU0886551.1 response regulator [Alphaproteobacteria bacterium]MBU1814139.1 response regulator [Alphaproteobacteria bacterium]MBU2089716.1 response regulator [Alphaproteobacteria bacterium]
MHANTLLAGGAALAGLTAAGSAVLSQPLALTVGAGLCAALLSGALALRGGKASPAKDKGLGTDDGSSPLWLIFENAPLAVAFADHSGRVLEANPLFQELTGLQRDGHMPIALAELILPEDRPALAECLARASSGTLQEGAVELRMAQNAERVGALLASRLDGLALNPEAGHSAEMPALMLYLLDVTQRKKLEAQFVQSQKMQAVGQLAGGVAHDFNNLLTAMIGFCDLLLLRHRAGDQSFADIMQIKQNANRAANLVRQLLAFSRQQTLRPRVLDTSEVLAELSHLLRRVMGENIQLRMRYGRNLNLIKVDQGQLEQVILNLAVNARDAMPDGGALTICTENMSPDGALRYGEEEVPAGDYVRIEVQDTGTGIEDAILPRIFEPFFTTKAVGSGTGLGLSTVYGIVKQTGGYIQVESGPFAGDEEAAEAGRGRGTRFSILLPVHDGDIEARTDAGEEAEGKGRDLTGAGTIMLVEDEDAVRLFSARALRNKGYRVIEARSGEAALEILTADESEPIDLLITDVVMPGIDGPTLIRTVRERRPDIKVICISGYSEDALREKIAADSDISFLSKPFSLKQLAGRVKEVLNA